MKLETNRPKIGIALGTGAARGIAHLGVLKVFQEEGIPIDFLAGTSMGSIVAGCFAAGIPIDKLEKMALDIDRKQVRGYFSPAFTRHGIAHGRKIEDILRGIIGDITFADLKIPLKVMCTDLISGKEVILSEGSVVKALRASISIPILFTPVRYQDMLLVDGGLVDPIPAGLIAKMGADIIVAVDVTRDVKKSLQKTKQNRFEKVRSFFSRWKKWDKKSEWTPSMLQVMLQTIKITEAKIAELQLSEQRVDVLIKPNLDDILLLEFKRAPELIALGEKAALDVIPLIRQKIHQFHS